LGVKSDDLKSIRPIAVWRLWGLSGHGTRTEARWRSWGAHRPSRAEAEVMWKDGTKEPRKREARPGRPFMCPAASVRPSFRCAWAALPKWRYST